MKNFSLIFFFQSLLLSFVPFLLPFIITLLLFYLKYQHLYLILTTNLSKVENVAAGLHGRAECLILSATLS